MTGGQLPNARLPNELYEALSRRRAVIEEGEVEVNLKRPQENGKKKNGKSGKSHEKEQWVTQAFMDEQLGILRRKQAFSIQEISAKCRQEWQRRKDAEAELEALRAERAAAPVVDPATKAATLASAGGEDGGPQQTSESRLRAAMTSCGVTTEELQEAILSVEAMVGEAKRELQNRQYRERRAAFERLHNAIAKADEVELTEALVEARRAKVEDEDIEKAEEVLHTLRLLTNEQRAAKALREKEGECRSRAFLLVKRDDLEKLRELFEEAEEIGLKWKTWKDHAQRNLLQCASHLQAQKVEKFLQPILNPKPLRRPSIGFRLPTEINAGVPSSSSTSPAKSKGDEVTSGDFFAEDCEATAGDCTGEHVECGPEEDGPYSPSSPLFQEPQTPAASEAALPPDEEAQLQRTAFRSVVKDDTLALSEIIRDRVPMETWRGWLNKGGKDLLTLAEERGSWASYCMLARDLGVMKERRRTHFDEREFVWVMFAGDVQARRATVIQDATEEQDDIFVEFWDDDSPPSWVSRDFVLKSN